jgi:Rhodopirellula transposase DDE domain
METVLGFARTVIIKGKQPVVTLVNKIYKTGIKLTKKAMKEIEKQIERLPELKKWFVTIPTPLE